MRPTAWTEVDEAPRRPAALRVVAESPVRLQEKSFNQKLARIEVSPSTKSSFGIALRAVPPYVSSTYASIAATCPTSCAFKDRGCFTQSGVMVKIGRKMDAAARGLSALEVAIVEARAIDGAFGGRSIPQDGAKGGRDLRLHVAGDATSTMAAAMLAGAAARWRERGGGRVWTYTHAWSTVRRWAWGGVSALASVESARGAEAARANGYAPALVVARLPSGPRAFRIPGASTLFVPCPAEQERGMTCVRCRLCLDDEPLVRRDLGIAFEAHGTGAQRVRALLERHGA